MSDSIENTESVNPVAVDVALLLAEHGTKSAVIRFLSAQGYKRVEIAKMMEIRYQHVRNVLTQPLKKKELL